MFQCQVIARSKIKKKKEKYQGLCRELCRIWQLKEAKVVPIAVGNSEDLEESFGAWLEALPRPWSFVMTRLAR